jgi:arylsulfatase A-like enzyme
MLPLELADNSQSDHGLPFLGKSQNPVDNPHNDPYRTPFIIYNPNIRNSGREKIHTNVYAAAIPTTILDLMSFTKSFGSSKQELAMQFAGHYEHAQSFLRPVKESIRFFAVNPGANQWVLDNGRNLRVNSLMSLLM